MPRKDSIYWGEKHLERKQENAENDLHSKTVSIDYNNEIKPVGNINHSKTIFSLSEVNWKIVVNKDRFVTAPNKKQRIFLNSFEIYKYNESNSKNDYNFF